MKRLSFLVLTILIASCSGENPVNTPSRTSTTVKIPFRMIRHERFFFSEEPAMPLIVLRSSEEEEQFLDTTKTRTNYIDFSSYEDSMLVVLTSQYALSVSNDFAIDSVVADTLINEMTIHAHNFFPLGRMNIFAIHSHIVAIPKTKLDIVLDIRENFETTESTVIPFKDFLKHGGSFSYVSETPLLVTLRSQADQDSFLNEINYVPNFPEFGYSDSMLVGVLSQEFNHVTPFEIVSIIQFENIIEVSTQFLYVGMFPSVEGSYHFVSVKKYGLPFVLGSNTPIYLKYD